MTQLVLGAVGYAFLGPVGWGIGVWLGGYIEQKNQPPQIFEGPKLNDLKVSAATYGNSIHTVYGAMRLNGNMLWSSGLKEHRHEETVGGGKGDAAPEQKQVSYSYTADFAMAFCEGEVVGIRKIWADSILIYDAGGTYNGFIPSQASGISVYSGSETQLPDSLLESYLGVGNVSAHRGLCYVVFHDFALGRFGNRIPNITAEVVGSGSSGVPTITPSTASGSANAAVWSIKSPGSGVIYVLAHNSVAGSRPVMQVVGNSVSTMVTLSEDTSGTVLRGFGADEANSLYFITEATLSTSLIRIYSYNASPITTLDSQSREIIVSGLVYLEFSTGVDRPPISGGGIVSAPDGLRQYVVFYNLSSNKNYFAIVNVKSGVYYDTLRLLHTPTAFASSTLTMNLFGYRVFMYYPLQNTEVSVIRQLDLAVVGTIAHSFSEPFVVRVYAYGAGDFVVLVFATLTQFEIVLVQYDTGEEQWRSSVMAGDVRGACIDQIGGVWVFLNDSGGGASSAVHYDGNTGNASGVTADFSGVTVDTSFNCLATDNTGRVWVKGQYYFMPVFNDLTANPPSLSSVVSEIIKSCGIPYNLLNVSDLTSTTVRGYTRTRQMTARAVLEPLQKAYQFDLIESDGKIKAVKRGGLSIDTIIQDDLAAIADSDGTPDDVTITKSAELELPRKVYLTYASPNFDYQSSVQIAQRLVSDSSNEINVELPIALSDSEAAQVADILLYNAWTEKERYRVALSFKYLELDPADIITVTTDDATYTMRFNKIEIQDGILNVEAAAEESALYSSSAIAVSPVTAVPQSLQFIFDTFWLLLDISLLRDVDDDTGYYVAACNVGDGTWPGAVLFTSTDAGETYNGITAIVREATLGYVTSELGDGYFTVFDELNTVTVALVNGELSSATEASVLNGSNAALVGNEIIQFETVVQNEDGSFTLSKLLRGRLGTEWAMAQHQTGERFVLLSETTLLRIPMSTNALDQSRKYKVPTVGQALQNVMEKDFTNRGTSNVPYSVVHVDALRDASNNLTVTWIRRTRKGGGWRDYVDVAIAEATEEYEVDFVVGGTVIRTKTVTSETVTYTVAEQTADGNIPGQQYTVRIYQMSEIVGRGYVNEQVL